MGFSKNKVAQEIPVSFTVRVLDERTGLQVESECAVTHIFRRPTIKERELYRQMASSFEKGKAKLRVTKANLALWDTCILRVEGYDDLPADGNFKSYFLEDDLIGKAHADAAASLLLNQIAETEVEQEKNSDEL